MPINGNIHMNNDGEPLTSTNLIDFSILVLVTVLVTIGGYVINDYFDLKIDQINRPQKQVDKEWKGEET